MTENAAGPTRIGDHELQHPDHPTWCTVCGEFAEYLTPDVPCRGAGRAFDFRVPGNAAAQLGRMFDLRAALADLRAARIGRLPHG